MTGPGVIGSSGGDGSLEGHRFDDVAGEERSRAVALAFDYRGDVTLRLGDGRTLTGYVFSHHPEAPDPHLKLFPADRDEKVTVRYAEIAGIAFSGSDRASGRSWRAWVERHEEKRRLAAEGVEVGDIEPRSDDLD